MKEVDKKDISVSYVYDPIKDVSPVDQFGFVDLRSAYLNNSIPGELTVSEQEYNGVDEPGSLIGKASDVFDALRKAEYVKSAEASAAAAEAAAASSSASE